MRWHLLRLAVALAIFVVACTGTPTTGPSGPASARTSPSPTVAGGPEVNAWYRAALGEGPVRIYADVALSESDELTRLFARRYPNVKVNWMRGDDRDLLTQALARGGEAASGFDVFLGDAGISLKEVGLAARWAPPEGRALRREYADPEGAWYAVAATYYVLQVNSELVPPAVRPRAYEQLLHEGYANRLAVEDRAATWLKGLFETRGRDQTLDLLGRIARQGVVVRRGPQVLSQFVSAGQHAVAISNRLDVVERDRRAGAKTAWVGIEPVVAQPTPVVVSAAAPHPNTAMLFANFLLSADAQTALAQAGRVPTRIDVDPDPQDLVRGLRIHLTLPASGAEARDLEARYADLWR